MLLGASTVACVGDSYIAEPNWGFTYAVLVPIVVSFALRVVQRVDVAALGEMAARGMIATRAGGAPAVARSATRGGAWARAWCRWPAHRGDLGGDQRGRAVAPLPAAPIPGTWWSESAVMGAVGAVCQGLLIALILLFVIHSVSWGEPLHGWTSPRAALRLQVDSASPDARRGFELLEEPMVLGLVTALLVGVTLYLSNVEHLAEAWHESFLGGAAAPGRVDADRTDNCSPMPAGALSQHHHAGRQRHGRGLLAGVTVRPRPHHRRRHGGPARRLAAGIPLWLPAVAAMLVGMTAGTIPLPAGTARRAHHHRRGGVAGQLAAGAGRPVERILTRRGVAV